MKLKDLLKNTEVHITYRTNSPLEDEEDMLFGYCTWTGKQLISGDGDNYSIEDIIEKFAWTSDSDLIVWFESRWITG